MEERARNRASERAEGRGVGPEEVAAAVARAAPRPKEHSNFTDPESRIMKTLSGWTQGYNAQVLVEEASGVIVAQEVSAHSADSPRLRPMLDRLEENLAGMAVPEGERRPKWFTVLSLKDRVLQRTQPGNAGGTAD